MGMEIRIYCDVCKRKIEESEVVLSFKYNEDEDESDCYFDGCMSEADTYVCSTWARAIQRALRNTLNNEIANG